MDESESVVVDGVILSLGIINFVLILLICLSCLCLPGSRIGRRLMKIGWYKRFFGNHCYLWAVLWPSVLLHAFRWSQPLTPQDFESIKNGSEATATTSSVSGHTHTFDIKK